MMLRRHCYGTATSSPPPRKNASRARSTIAIFRRKRSSFASGAGALPRQIWTTSSSTKNLSLNLSASFLPPCKRYPNRRAFPGGDEKLAPGQALDQRVDQAKTRRGRRQDIVLGTPPVACRERFFLLPLRRGRYPHGGWRRRMGHRFHGYRKKQRAAHHPGGSLPSFFGSSLQRLHRFSRL